MLNEYYETYNDTVVVAINLTRSDNLETAVKYIKDLDYDFTFLLDKTGSIDDNYEVSYVPMIYLIDEDGVIKYKGNAPYSSKDLRQMIEEF